MDFIKNHLLVITLIVGIIAGFPLVRYRKTGLNYTSDVQVLVTCIVFTALSALSAVIFASFEGLITGKGLNYNGVSTYGIYFICPLLLLFIYRKKRSSIFDAYAYYVLPSMILQRVRCLVDGCCYGKIIGNIRFPTRELEILFYILMFLCFMKKDKDITEGSKFPLLMISYGFFRFFEEFMREGAGLFHLAHIWSVLAMIIGYSIYIEFNKDKMKKAG